MYKFEKSCQKSIQQQVLGRKKSSLKTKPVRQIGQNMIPFKFNSVCFLCVHKHICQEFKNENEFYSMYTHTADTDSLINITVHITV